MSDQANRRNVNLLPASRGELAPVVAANPLVARGLADLSSLRVAKLNALSDRLQDLQVRQESAPREIVRSVKTPVPHSESTQPTDLLGHPGEPWDLTQLALWVGPPAANFYYHRGMDRLDREGYEAAIEDFDQAIRLCDDAIPLDPGSASTYLLRGMARVGVAEARSGIQGGRRDAFEEFAAGFKDFDEAIRVDPECALAFVEHGMAWVDQNDYDAAIQDFYEAIRLDPGSPTARHKLSLAYQSRGWRILRRLGLFWDPGEAMEDFDEAIRFDPNPADAYRERSEAWVRMENYDNAIKDLDAAIALAPDDAWLYSSRARIWKQLGEYDKAIRDYEATILIDPLPEREYTNLAELLLYCPDERLRNVGHAIQLAKLGCENHVRSEDNKGWDPDVGDPVLGRKLSTLAAAYAEAGQFDEAERYQQKALEVMHRKSDQDHYRPRLELYKQRKP
jgi:tetratricopeptide (TPR) repeat protein